MARTIFAGEALGYARMHAARKEDVIAYLAAADVPAPTRRRWYREWCKATFTKLRPDELDRVAPRQAKERQLGLLDDSSGRSADHGDEPLKTDAAAAATNSDGVVPGIQDRRSSRARVTASTSGE